MLDIDIFLSIFVYFIFFITHTKTLSHIPRGAFTFFFLLMILKATDILFFFVKNVNNVC